MATSMMGLSVESGFHLNSAWCTHPWPPRPNAIQSLPAKASCTFEDIRHLTSALAMASLQLLPCQSRTIATLQVLQAPYVNCLFAWVAQLGDFLQAPSWCCLAKIAQDVTSLAMICVTREEHLHKRPAGTLCR